MVSTRRVSAFKWIYPVEHEKRLKANKCKPVHVGNLSLTASFLSMYQLLFITFSFFEKMVNNTQQTLEDEAFLYIFIFEEKDI